MRKKAVKFYSAGSYEDAYSIINELLASDTTAFFWTDYALSADILLRKGKVDSAKAIIERGRAITEKSSDIRLIARNKEAFDNLSKQLKHNSKTLIFPAFKPLDTFTEISLKGEGKVEDFDSVTPDLVLVAPSKKKKNLREAYKANGAVHSSNDDSTKADSLSFAPDEIAEIISLPPIIEGGIEAVNSYIAANILYPSSEEAGYSEFGAAVVKVSVDTNGITSGIEAVRAAPANAGFEELAVEVFRNMKYEPGIGKEGKIAGIIQIPVLFLNPSEPLPRPVIEIEPPVEEIPAPAKSETGIMEEKPVLEQTPVPVEEMKEVKEKEEVPSPVEEVNPPQEKKED